jgi:nitroimidazol reductase NimA-like FMN-containing flavoprotein (pyridoxamine 5'-phosphate oxidase superfamily)
LLPVHFHHTVVIMTTEIPLSSTDRTRLRRQRDRGRADRAELYAVLDAGFLCHLGVICDGEPRVLPTGYGRRDDTLYLHGSTANRTMLAADGRPACVTVTHLDGLVCARSVFHHSLNYRSAMIYGTGRMLTDEAERMAALEIIVDNMIPGQWEAARGPNRKEMAATAVLAMPLDEASVKIRTGPPSDEPEDYALNVWAGVVPVRVEYGKPEPDSVLPDTIAVPEHLLSLGSDGPAA